MKKKKILCLVDYYLPGFRAGGPIRSIVNFVENLGEEFEIYIICNDRDMFDVEQYENVNIDMWNTVGKAKVFYASKKNLSLKGLKKILNETEYDLLHLNSFFSPRFTILPLLLRQFVLTSNKPCVISPKGNLSPEALKLKSFKKKVYFKLFKWLNLYKNLNWQASSEHERKDITNKLGNKAQQVYVVPDFPPSPLKLIYSNNIKSRASGCLRLLFLSRITPMKNLDFLLKVLIEVKVSIELSIYGPKEDANHWKECLNLINKLPSNIRVLIGDEVPQKQVLSIFDQHDLFVSPTKGEAFGNAIIESLSAGLPALISDKTLWNPDQEGGLEVLKLDKCKWVDAITKWSKFENQILKKKRQIALNYAKNYYEDTLTLKKNKDFFYSIL